MKPDAYQREAITRALGLCEASLREPLAVASMAEAACYSLFHFCRVFAATTGHTPYQYLLRRRLCEAAREVEAGSHNLSRIAFDYQFGSPETFSRAFRRLFGVLPSQWRRQGAHHPSLFMPAFSEELLEHLHQRVTFDAPAPPVPATLHGLMAPGYGEETARGLQSAMPWLAHSEARWQARVQASGNAVYTFVGTPAPHEGMPLACLALPAEGWFTAAHSDEARWVGLTLVCLRHIRLAHMLPVQAERLSLACLRRHAQGTTTHVYTRMQP